MARGDQSARRCGQGRSPSSFLLALDVRAPHTHPRAAGGHLWQGGEDAVLPAAGEEFPGLALRRTGAGRAGSG